MKLHYTLYQIDTFTDKIFHGNSAAVVPLAGDWLPDRTMQSIAMENNLSETAFYIQKNGDYHIRWFTPTIEVDPCGHATLASAFVLFNHEGFSGETVSFNSRSGVLNVSKAQNGMLTLDFPADEIQETELTAEMVKCFQAKPEKVFRGKTDFMFVFASEEEIVNPGHSLQNIAALDCRGVIITAPGKNHDFVSRFFGPQSGINEDPVTGSAHTTLVPYWSNLLKKDILTAAQLSERSGELRCKNLGGRVEISGSAVLYMKGEICTDFIH